MVFSNLIFLYLFLPVCLIFYFLCQNIRAKNAVLIVFSLIFYAWGEPVYLLLMLASVAVNWGFGLLIERRRKKVFLILALVLDLGCLAVFKYAGFFVENLNALFRISLTVPQIPLPIGISFYTFQALSYTVDVWRGDVPAQRSFAKLLLYISLFPQLIAGPIVRYSDVAAQIDDRQFDASEAFYGATRFCVGLAKKVLLADAAGKVASQILDGSLASSTTVAAWLGILLYTFEIYFDFSGYSDMAIGLGRIFGFRYCENFDLPYISTSITEFWRRWHMSLGSFFRYYVYIPLGGNRRGKARQILNLLAVWALTGLWHGASWNFVLWGLYFFVLLSIEKQIAPKLETLPFIVRNLVTMFFVLIGWVLFMNTSLSGIGSAFTAMFGGGTSFAGSGVSLQLKNSLPLLLTCLIGSSVLPRWFGFIWSGLFGMGRSDRRGAVTVKKGIYLASVFLFLILLLWLCTVSLVGSTSSPSMYAQF